MQPYYKEYYHYIDKLTVNQSDLLASPFNINVLVETIRIMLLLDFGESNIAVIIDEHQNIPRQQYQSVNCIRRRFV